MQDRKGYDKKERRYKRIGAYARLMSLMGWIIFFPFGIFALGGIVAGIWGSSIAGIPVDLVTRAICLVGGVMVGLVGLITAWMFRVFAALFETFTDIAKHTYMTSYLIMKATDT